MLKVSHEELIQEGRATGGNPDELFASARRLSKAGADIVVVSRAEEPVLALVDGMPYELVGPRFEARDPTGAGDSMFAAIGVALAAGQEPLGALRTGVAAGALNVTRRGLGTGRPADVERMTARVSVRRLDPDEGALPAIGGGLGDELDQ